MRCLTKSKLTTNTLYHRLLINAIVLLYFFMGAWVRGVNNLIKERKQAAKARKEMDVMRKEDKKLPQYSKYGWLFGYFIASGRIRVDRDQGRRILSKESTNW